MRTFFKDERGDTTLTIYGLMTIVGLIAYGTTVLQTNLEGARDLRLAQAKANSCAQGDRDCAIASVKIDDGTVVFLKAE